MKIIFLIHVINEFGQKLWFPAKMFNILKSLHIYYSSTGSAASKLKDNGFEIIWDDGNSELKSYEEWFDDLIKLNPDIIYGRHYSLTNFVGLIF